jgi:signal peptidase I
MGIRNLDQSKRMESSQKDKFVLADGTVSPGKERTLTKFLLELIEIFLIAGALFLAVNTATARVRVESISMEPNLYDGEFVVVNRLAYRWSNPERGDIIVFYFPENPKKRYIKRIIGIEGDLVSVSDGQVYVNGDLLYEPYLASAPTYSGEWQVGPGELFVLGDNRNNSNDSKSWGNLKVEAVIGKAIFIYWPLKNLGLIPHYDLMQNVIS